MLRKWIISLALLAPALMWAQTAVATVDVKGLFDRMPEKVEAEAKLKDLSDRYQEEYQRIRAEFSRKYTDYQAIANDATVPQTIKERRIQDIHESDRKISEYEGAVRADIDAQREQLLAPIRERLNQAIKAVADAEGVTYVLDTAQGVVYQGPAAVNLTAKVARHLGLE